MEQTGERWVGASIRRVEDQRLLTGRGRFVDDLPSHRGELHARFVRAAVGAGDVLCVDAGPALAIAGVEAVITASDLDLPGLTSVVTVDGYVLTEMPLLVADRVRYAGEPVAVVLAESPYVAEDAAEVVDVEYEAHGAVVGLAAAQEADAPLLHETASRNRLLDHRRGNAEHVAAIVDAAEVVVEVETASARVTAAPMEARGIVAVPAPDGTLQVYASTQVPHYVRLTLARLLGLAERQVQVVAPDVGGGFGQKCAIAREELVAAVLAYRTGRPVRWIEDRVENLTAGVAGHEQVIRLRAGFRHDGTLEALDADIQVDVGAYSAYPFSCTVEPMMAVNELSGAYRVPELAARTRGVATNKAPMAPYRGVARPQVVMAMERLMEKAAERLSCSSFEVRRRNVIGKDGFPVVSPTGLSYDAGSYEESLVTCEQLVEQAGWTRTRAAAKNSPDRRLGIGLACFAEHTGFGTPSFAKRGMTYTPGYESARVSIDPSGAIEVALSSGSQGQGHQTTMAQIVADRLGVAPDSVRVTAADTSANLSGWGTFASRSIVMMGGACHEAGEELALKVRRVAAHLLEVDPGDVVLLGGRCQVAGSPEASVDLSEVAYACHYAAQQLPVDESPGLAAEHYYDAPGTFANAVHAALVEVDLATGKVLLDDYVVVEDCGVVINPMIVDGQVRGGVAQGIAAALYEALEFDVDGQCLTSTFIDYLMPTASDVPKITVVHHETPSERSVTGAKGMGEGGMIGAPAAVLNAVNDALSDLGVEFSRIPITPREVRAAMRKRNHVST